MSASSIASADAQAAFADALLDPAAACPPGLVAWNGSDPARRYAVYRNNVASSLIGALADTYPVVYELVGDDFFRAMARGFVCAQPPRSAVLAEYGGDFADFIERWAPAASLPYLADVARLEWLRVRAYGAPDAEPLSANRLAAALARPDLLPQLPLVPHPATGVLVSRHAVVSLWAAHQGALAFEEVDPAVTQCALVMRPTFEVAVVGVDVGTAHFVQSLAAGSALGVAHEEAVAADGRFDLAAALALLLCHGALGTLDFATGDAT